MILENPRLPMAIELLFWFVIVPENATKSFDFSSSHDTIARIHKAKTIFFIHLYL